MEALAVERLDFGKMDYGCKHYSRRCKIRAPCCNEIFGCRHCHNDSTVTKVCSNCGVNMGEYFCDICKFYDDDVRLASLDPAIRLAYAINTFVWKTQCGITVPSVMRYACPICSKSAIDMSKYWRTMDDEVAATLMPENYRGKKVWILCNDCNDTTEVIFHVIGQKCGHCNSYNTRTIAPPVCPQ
ncbi:hypothetical protein QJS04_geneDACA020117 [Acorus gramineus]|uniref:CHY-type domain-containing protein n=1 Tax=Acorus gramineus TaxID=55184 RepID=A0AAV8ZWJ6_ACOGR|nr:hypothetical protein QJS04_geneDACA020117 [Acorus gramineus]